MPEHSFKHKRVSIRAICILNKKKGIPASHSCLPLGRWVFHSHLLPRLGFYFVQLFFTTLVTYHPKGCPVTERQQTKQQDVFSTPNVNYTKNRNKKHKNQQPHTKLKVSSNLNPSPEFYGRSSLGLAPDFRWGLYLEEETVWVWLKSPKKMMMFLDFWWCLMIVVDFWWFLWLLTIFEWLLLHSWHLPKQNSWIWGVFSWGIPTSHTWKLTLKRYFKLGKFGFGLINDARMLGQGTLV